VFAVKREQSCRRECRIALRVGSRQPGPGGASPHDGGFSLDCGPRMCDSGGSLETGARGRAQRASSHVARRGRVWSVGSRAWGFFCVGKAAHRQ